MTSGRQLSLIAGGISAALLVAALAFQAAGFVPCELCILQRWPHLGASLIAVLIWVVGYRPSLALLGALATTAAAAIAIYHSGVEWHLWAGPASCTGAGPDFRSLSASDLTTQLMKAPVVRCDEPALKIMGVTMANMNALASAGLTAIWLLAARHR